LPFFRLRIGPVGGFDLSIGPETPSIHVLMPGLSAEAVAIVETLLAKAAEYTKAGATFLNAPAKEPAFDRMDSSFLRAFQKWPRLVSPVV
jgi:hypothetical protein